MKWSLIFAWYGICVGAYFDRKQKVWYVCLIPTLVLKLERKEPEPKLKCGSCDHFVPQGNGRYSHCGRAIVGPGREACKHHKLDGM